MEDAGSQRWQQLRALLRDRPDARLNAMDEAGLFVPLPPGMQALGQPSLVARSGIESVLPEHHGLAIRAWLRVLDHGHAAMEVRDRSEPDWLTRVEFFDLRPELGVLAAVAFSTVPVPGRDRGQLTDPADPPRLGRVRKDARGRFLDADPAVDAMLGYGPGGLVGRLARELLHPDDRMLATSTWMAVLARPSAVHRLRLRIRRADGSWLWADVVNINLLADPAYGCVLADVVDVSREMTFREDVRARERLLQRLTQALPVGVVQLSASGLVGYSNTRFHELLGLPARPSFGEQLATLRAADRARLLVEVDRALTTGRDTDLLVERVEAGQQWVLEVALRPLVDEDGVVEGLLGCLTDTTESVRLRAELEQRATCDVLTGCLNRGAVLRRLEEELRGVAPGRGCAVLFLDLDGFKRVNDTRGHAAGDEVLRGVAAVLRSAARAGDAVGRIGGDEFVLVCPGVASGEQALALAVDVRTRLARSGGAGTIGASTGVAYTDDPALAAETVLGRADSAMYAAKRDRRATAVLWSGPAHVERVRLPDQR